MPLDPNKPPGQAHAAIQARTESRLPRFLELLGDGAGVSAAAEGAGLHPATVYRRRQSDPEFAARWVDAVEKSTETLEAEARRRALQGSDTMLIFLLKARRPEVYRENHRITVESRGADAREAAALRELVAHDPEAREALVAAARVLAAAQRDERPALPAGEVIDVDPDQDAGGDTAA